MKKNIPAANWENTRAVSTKIYIIISFILLCKVLCTGQEKKNNESETNGLTNTDIIKSCYVKLSLGKTSNRPFVELLSHSIGAGIANSTPSGIGLPIDSSWFSIFERDMQSLQGGVFEEDMWLDLSAPAYRNITYNNSNYFPTYDGPSFHGIAMKNGFSISFSGVYDYLDFWVKNASVGAQIQFYSDGTLYRTVVIKSSGTYYTGDGTTTNGNGVSHNWTIKAVCTPDQSIGLASFNRGLIKDYSNKKQPFNFMRCAVPGWNTGTYLPRLKDINDVTGDSIAQHGVVIISLEANDWNDMLPDRYNINLDSIVKSIISAKNIPFIAYTAKPFPFTALEGGSQIHNDGYEVYESISRSVANKYGIGWVSASSEDFNAQGFFAGAGDVHFNNAGHRRFAEIVETGIANFLTLPKPITLVNSFSPYVGTSQTEVTITGINLVNTTAVSFGGVPAASFTIVSSDTIKAVVGKGSSGNVTVTTEIGTANSPGFIFPKPVQFCASQGSTLATNTTGQSYQWQRDTGTGFIDIPDNLNFSGAKTSAVTLSSIPYSWNNYLFRCKVDNVDTASVYNILLTKNASPSVTINSSTNSICMGQSLSFTATTIDGGMSPSFIWQINGINSGTNSSSFTTNSLNNNDQVKVLLTSNLTCAIPQVVASNNDTIFVSNSTTPTITISTANPIICQGQIETFNASITNGGTSPNYQWQINGINAGTNNNLFTTSTLNNNDQVKAVLTSSATCTTQQSVISNVIATTVNTSVVPAIAISSTKTTVCAGSAITFTATPINGGASPSYQWKVNGTGAGANSSTFTNAAFNNNDQVELFMTSNAICTISQFATSNVIAVTIKNNLLPTISISTPNTTVCLGSAVAFNTTSTNTGTSPSYQWFINGVNTGISTSSFISTNFQNNDNIQVKLTSNADCVLSNTVSSNVVSIAVTTPAQPSITISGDLLDLGVPSILSSITKNAGMYPLFQWQDSTSMHSWENINGASGQAITYSKNTLGNKVRCILTSNADCLTSYTSISNIITVLKSGVHGEVIYYPNPSDRTLILDKLYLTDHWQTVSISNILGKVNLIKQNITGQIKVLLNIAMLPNGVYIATLVNDKGELFHFKFEKI